MTKNLYLTLRPAVNKIMDTLFNPEIIYEEEIPKEGRIILVSNHISNFDSLLLSKVTDRHIHFLAKEELFKGPLKLFFNSLGCVPVNREGNGMESIKQAVNLLNEDKCIAIFPEGKRNSTDQVILPFKLGTIMIAKRGRADIIPCSITGNYKLTRNNSNLKVRVGKRIITSDYNTKELLEKVEEDVKSLILKR